MRGSQRSGGQASQVGRVSFSEPVDRWDALLGKEEGIGQDAGVRAQRMPGRNEQMLPLVSWIGGEQETTADGFVQRSRRAGWVEEVGRRLTERADEQDGAAGLLSEFVEGGQAAHEAGEGTGGIEDQQARVQATDGIGKMVEDGGEDEGVCAGWSEPILPDTGGSQLPAQSG